MSVATATRKASVKESTTRTWWKKLQEDPDTFTLEKKINRQNKPKSRLQEEHKQSLIEFFDDNANAHIQDAVEMLTSKFEGLEIKKSKVHEFMRDECNLSMKQTTCWPEARTNKENVQKRYEWVFKWSNTDMDFSRNCIFIDEAGFDINVRAIRAWAPRRQMAVITTPTTKAPSHTILGAIPSVGVVNLSIRVPKQHPKVRKVQEGTTAGHYMRFIQETLSILDKYDQMRGFYFIMDNAPIHKQIEDMLCDKCKKSFQDASQLKNHKGNYHCLSLTVKYNDRQGNSTALTLKKDQQDKIICPICCKSWNTRAAVWKHFSKYNGNCQSFEVASSSDEENNSAEIANPVITMSPTLAAVPETNHNSPRRSFDEALLAACRQTGKPYEEKNKTIWILDSMNLQPFSMIDNTGVEQVALTLPVNLAAIIKPDRVDNHVELRHISTSQKRRWDGSVSSSKLINNSDDMEARFLSITHYGPFASILSKRHFTELKPDICQMLNDDWEAFAQLRFVCSQLLAGAIIINNKGEAVILNTVEAYGRSRSMDVHRERVSVKKGFSSPSSLPPINTRYPKTWATILNDSEGKKLVVGSKSMNVLVTSSLRVDIILPLSVGGITAAFDLPDGKNADIFLDKDSITKANALARNPSADKIDQHDLLHQLRQVRSSFHLPSTYMLCRSASEFTDDKRSKPFTIYTYADYDGGDHDSSNKIASQLFQKIGLNIILPDRKSVLNRTHVESLYLKYPNSEVKTVLKSIMDDENEEEIMIVGNKSLNQNLQILAAALSSSISSANKTVTQIIQSTFIQSHQINFWTEIY
ncbi:hypothetical protein G6F43_009134 [Rhizopus delemar]|nr:hypothetical protein G6F43_009134 [Rhizopus delemar]